MMSLMNANDYKQERGRKRRADMNKLRHPKLYNLRQLPAVKGTRNGWYKDDGWSIRMCSG